MLGLLPISGGALDDLGTVVNVAISGISYAVVRAIIDDLANFLATNMNNDPTSVNIASLIQTFIAVNGQSTIPLSGVSVDYETNLAEMQSILANTQTWQDTTNAGTGVTITQMVATAMAYNQFTVVRAAQESMIPTAVIDSSIYTGTQFLGVRLVRRLPAEMPVTLNNSGSTATSLELPAYTQFIANSVFLFNRDPVIFPAGVVSVDAILYEGQVQNTNFTSDGTGYQTLEIGASDYTISDVDTTVKVDNISWQRTEFQTYFNIGLWEYGPGDQVFEDTTTPDGNVSLNFGNNINGAIPASGATISVTYVSTNGQQGNVDSTGATITCSSNSQISGTVTGMAGSGTNQRTASDYKSLSPGQFFAKYRAITRADQAAIARQYPGVIDAVWEGQQELYPMDLRYMMVTQVTILPITSWGSSQWNAFIAWMSNLNIAQQIVLQNNPIAIPIDIVANVYVLGVASSLSSLQNLITANLQAAFLPRAGILGYSRPLSDIGRIIENSDASIDYYDITSPTADVTASIYQYVTINSITLNMAYSSRGVLS